MGSTRGNYTGAILSRTGPPPVLGVPVTQGLRYDRIATRRTRRGRITELFIKQLSSCPIDNGLDVCKTVDKGLDGGI